jgi:hypothetical protein
VVIIIYSSTSSLLSTDLLLMFFPFHMSKYFIFDVAVDAGNGQTLLPSTVVEEKWIGAEISQTILELLLYLYMCESRECLSFIDESHRERMTNDFKTDRFITKNSPCRLTIEMVETIFRDATCEVRPSVCSVCQLRSDVFEGG